MPANLLIGLSGWFPSSKPGCGLLDNVDPSKPEQFPLCWSRPSTLYILLHLSKEIPVVSYAEDVFLFPLSKTSGKWHVKIQLYYLLFDRRTTFLRLPASWVLLKDAFFRFKILVKIEVVSIVIGTWISVWRIKLMWKFFCISKMCPLEKLNRSRIWFILESIIINHWYRYLNVKVVDIFLKRGLVFI